MERISTEHPRTHRIPPLGRPRGCTYHLGSHARSSFPWDAPLMTPGAAQPDSRSGCLGPRVGRLSSPSAPGATSHSYQLPPPLATWAELSPGATGLRGAPPAVPHSPAPGWPLVHSAPAAWLGPIQAPPEKTPPRALPGCRCQAPVPGAARKPVWPSAVTLCMEA